MGFLFDDLLIRMIWIAVANLYISGQAAGPKKEASATGLRGCSQCFSGGLSAWLVVSFAICAA
jgi:hypothetical protein